MKNIFSILILSISLLFIRCGDVIDVDLKNSEPKIVIDASLKWTKGTIGNYQVIKLSKTGNYFSNNTPPVNGATVVVSNSSGTNFIFLENGNSGNYECFSFIPQINENYTLTVITNGVTYTASDKLYAVPDITSIDQRNDAGFTGTEIEVKFNFQDNPTENNFYLEQYNVPFNNFPFYGVFNDEFSQGNEMFSLLFDEDIQSGQNINFTLHGISERYHNYMNIIIGISGGLSNGPFSTPPATVRGNIINTTNTDDFPLGYFRLSEVVNRNYIVQ